MEKPNLHLLFVMFATSFAIIQFSFVCSSLSVLGIFWFISLPVELNAQSRSRQTFTFVPVLSYLFAYLWLHNNQIAYLTSQFLEGNTRTQPITVVPSLQNLTVFCKHRSHSVNTVWFYEPFITAYLLCVITQLNLLLFPKSSQKWNKNER